MDSQFNMVVIQFGSSMFKAGHTIEVIGDRESIEATIDAIRSENLHVKVFDKSIEPNPDLELSMLINSLPTS